MTDDDENAIVATAGVDDALATPTVIDQSELETARLDARWRDFCLNADAYVARSTRLRPSSADSAADPRLSGRD